MSITDYAGQVLDDRYRLIRLLGEGGMGSVYLGKHLMIGRDVAVKLLHGRFAENEDVVKRFYREAQAAAAIRHRNIIDVLDVGTAPWGDPYLVMEYLEGENLADLLTRSGPVDLVTACGILEPVLLALSAAHEIGVVHRDLKPENVFIAYRKGEPPEIKLIDFGISKFVGGGDKTRLTQTGFMLGTPAYMSPEQARGQSDVDHLTDIYSCGVIFYEMLTGDLPFVGNNYNELLVNILTTEPRSPYQVCPGFQPEAEAPVMRALSKAPEMRFQSAVDMLAALKAVPGYERRSASLAGLSTPRLEMSFATGDLGEVVERGTPSAWTPRTTFGKVKRARRPVVIASALAAVGLLGAAALAIFILLSKSDATPPQDVVANQVEEHGVLIAIEGVPDGAKVFYDDIEMRLNPFPVDEKHTMAAVRIEAEGFIPIKVGVLPTEDRTVTVSMVPVGAEDTNTAGTAVVVEGISDARREESRKHRESASKKASKKDTPSESTPKGGETKIAETEVAETAAPDKKLSREEVQSVMGPLVATARKQCGQGADQKVNLKLRVDGSGKVVGAEAVGPSAKTPTGECVVGLASALSFPAFGGSTMVVSYPVVLKTGKPQELPKTLSKQQVAEVMSRAAKIANAKCSGYSTGTVAMKVVVASSGAVEDAKATGTFAGTEAGQCVAQIVRGATFPEFSDPRLNFSYPVILKSKAGSGSSEGSADGAEAGLPKTPSKADVQKAMAPVVSRSRQECSKLGGETVRLRLMVRADGTVAEATPIGASASTPAGRCVADIARKAVFPKFSKPTFTVSYPVVLK